MHLGASAQDEGLRAMASTLTVAEMLDVVAPSDALETACLQLIEMANQGGGEDAFTVIEARFDGERRLSSSEKTISASLHIN